MKKFLLMTATVAASLMLFGAVAMAEENNEIQIGALSQVILCKVNRNISKQGIVLYLKDYVERQEFYQEHEKT